MSKCRLSVAIDQAGRRFTFGDKVTGHVTAQAGADCRCNRLKAALLWKAHGHSRSSDGPRQEQVLFEGEWKAAESHRYPFEFEIPNGPVTYHGQELNVDWLVAAEADIASGLDARVEETFVVTVGDDPNRVTLPEARTPEQAARLAAVTAIGKVVLGAIVGAVGWTVFVMGVLAVAAGQNAGWMGVVAGAVFGLVGTSLAIAGARWLIGASFLRVMHLSLDPPACRAGGEVGVNLVFTPRRPITIDGITATIEGKERIVFGGSKSSTEFTHLIGREARPLGGPPSANPGLPVSVKGRLAVPGDAPHSFRLSVFDRYWEVEWTVHLRVALRGRPDWTRQLVLKVGP